jgi:N-acetylglucosaminyldiphosphoundecaprenol N-acetyl-beta-D-mannosaminyltransferase
MKQLILGLPLDALTMDDVLDRCRGSLTTRERTLVGVVNAAKMVRLRHDTHLRDSLLECDVLLADGQSVVWASRLLRRRLPERVAGIDLFERLLELAARDGWSVYLLGARPDVLATLQQRLGERFPALKIAGARDGYFAGTEGSSVAADIRQSGADMLFLGMTSPKKEIFLGDYGATLGAPVLHGVGGSFDILAGITKRAPVRWQRLGLEWLYRVLQEPRRLWRRYLTTNATFIALVLRELVRRQPPYQHSSGD